LIAANAAVGVGGQRVDQPGHRRLGPQHRDVGQTVTADGDADRQVQQDLPRIQHRPLLAPREPTPPTTPGVYTPEDLLAAAAQLNSRPRKTLDWDTPAQRLDMLLN